VRLALATALFKSEALSLGRCARLAETSPSEFITHLSRLGVSIVPGTKDDAMRDMETLEEWLRSS